MGITGNAKAQADKNLTALKKEWASKSKKVEDYVPAVTDKAAYKKLVDAVDKATAKNESVAAFEKRVKALGKAAEGLAKTIGII